MYVMYVCMYVCIVCMIRMYTQIDAGYPCVLYHLYLYCNFYTAAVPGTIKHVIVLHVVHTCTPGYICTVEPTLYAAQIDPLPLRSIWNFIATCKLQQLIHVDNFRFLLLRFLLICLAAIFFAIFLATTHTVCAPRYHTPVTTHTFLCLHYWADTLNQKGFMKRK